MTTALAPPDAEASLVIFLADASTRVPNPRPPGGYTRVTRVGGNRQNLIQGVTRALIECFDDNDEDAFTRAQLAWAQLGQAAQSYLAPGVWVNRVQLTDPVNFPDTSTTSARYQFIASLTLSLTPVEIP